MDETEQQQLTLEPAAALAILRAEAETLLMLPGRRILGIAGGPGVGKSTLARQLARDLGSLAAYVPMDGFHMKHAKLEALGTAADKGMPHTFEGAAFADFLAALKSTMGPMS